MARRHELSARIADQLKDKLNTVIPVAAGLRRELDRMLDDEERLALLIDTLRRIPHPWLETLLDSDELFCDFEPDDCPVAAAERRELLGETPWGIFATIAWVVADPTLGHEEVVERLEEMCGFERLWEVLNERFIQRGHVLRCYRIAREAQKTLNREIKYTYLPQCREETSKAEDRLEEFITFIQQARGDPATARRLQDFVRHHLDAGEQVTRLEKLHSALDLELSTLLYELRAYNADFEALQKLGSGDLGFPSTQVEELRALLGLYGAEVDRRIPSDRLSDAEYIGQRQRYWQVKKMEAPYGTPQYTVADRAFARYGLILDELYAT